ncbi:hypothetical protein BS17DRAFT_854111 [Gyrodon lividus]|nr:hypothetical protein BS17DRAFT_854111 [Gyrodon lividus]
MHLFLENIVPTLVNLWTGQIKGLDTGTENYELVPHIWAEIGEETACAVANIPSAFVRVLGNIAEDRSTFTAEAWGFWFVYLAPILLKGRFQEDKYYYHMLKLSDLMKIMVKLELRDEEVDMIENRLIEWVEEYEEYYYQYDEERLSTCTLPIHGLLHVAAGIRFCGPVWTSWTFSMEHFCGFLQAGLRSRCFPWSNLNKRILHLSYLSQLKVKFNLRDELEELAQLRRNIEFSRNECKYAGYPQHIFSSPFMSNFQPDDEMRRQIAVYLRQVIGGRQDQIIATLPRVMPLWGKVQLCDGDDRLRTVNCLQKRSRGTYRDNSFVRCEIVYESEDGTEIISIHYGRLERVLVC